MKPIIRAIRITINDKNITVDIMLDFLTGFRGSASILERGFAF